MVVYYCVGKEDKTWTRAAPGGSVWNDGRTLRRRRLLGKYGGLDLTLFENHGRFMVTYHYDFTVEPTSSVVNFVYY